MAFFITEQCDFQEINFFSNAAYTRGSFSQTWSTTTIPDNDFDGTPVFIQVLSKFNIPINSVDIPGCGQLPGIDIRNMDAIEAIKLSLAECLLLGEWWEIYEDGEGSVFFEKVFDNGSPGVSINLDIRSCIPSATKTNSIDMVIVSGYDAPPQSYIKEFRDVVPQGTGPINPESTNGTQPVYTVSESALLAEYCHGHMLAKTAYKSYKDPVKVSEFGGQEPNPFYSPKAFEQIRAYVVDIDGMNASPRVKYSFQTSSPLYVPVELPAFVRRSVPSCSVGLPTGPDIVYYESSFDFNVSSYNDRYGTPWPLINRPTGVLFIGYTLAAIGIFGPGGTAAYIQPKPELNTLAAGTNWVWDVNGSSSFTVNIFYKPNLGALTLEDWDSVLIGLAQSQRTFYTDIYDLAVGKTYQAANVGSQGLISIGNGLGTIMSKVWLVVDVDRPCVVIEDAEYDAISFASSLRIRHAPLIIYDPPAPIAYHHKDFGTVIVDQSQDLVDNDPTTCQNFENTDMQIMQDRQQGQVVQTQLPFCESPDACARVARTIFNYMTHEDTQTYSLICGPDDEPILGAHVQGFDGDLRIESITYSFQDGASYTTNVNLGPVFVSVGSWNNQAWLRKTEDVSRKAIVVWSAGDSTNYRVRVKGLGYYNAINATDMVFRSGEVVDVTIYNNPQEA